MSFYSFLSAIELGLIYSLTALGLFLSYRILNVPDLTADGSFTLGAATAIVFTLMGHPIFGIFAAVLAGALSGLVTAFLQTKMKIQPILAGIITMTALYSINLMVMDNKANLSITSEQSLYTAVGQLVGKKAQGMVLSFITAAGVMILLVLFFHTRLGLCVRATGDNEEMVRSSSVNADGMKAIGLATANACIALSGAMIAHYNCYAEVKMGIGMVVIGLASVNADGMKAIGLATANACIALSGAMIAHYNCYAEVKMGIGMVVIGLASLIIGEIAVELFVKNKTIFLSVFAAVIGSVLYRLIIAQALEMNFSASCLKLITAVIVAAAMSYPAVRETIEFYRKRRGRKADVEAARHQ